VEQSLLNLDDEAERIVRELGIPPCPTILTRLMAEMRQDEPDFRKIAALISSDVGLAAAMLKTVNSPFFGLRTKATSVQQAISLLGLKNVIQIVTGSLLRMAFPEGGEALDAYWERSAGIAQVAARLARPLAGLDRDEVYTFALFRDCGIPLMLRKYPPYADFLVEEEVTANRPVTQVEQILFKMDHARVGSQLAATWLLPEDLSEAILYHHDYPAVANGEVSEGVGKLVGVGLVAEYLYLRHVAHPTAYEWDKGGQMALELFETSEEELTGYQEEVELALAA